MATLPQHIYNIKNVAYHANPSINAKLREKQIQFWLQYYREMVMNQMYGKFPELIDNLLFQELGCIEIQHIDKAECPCGDIKWNCTVGKAEIPKPVTVDGVQQISITYVDRTTKLLLTPVGVVQEAVSARFTGKADRAFLTDSRTPGKANLYIITQNDDLMYLSGRIIPVDPTLVEHKELINGQCVTKCFSVERDEYPMNGLIAANVYRLIFENELKLTLTGFDDILNNNQEDQSLLQVKQILEQLDLYGKRSNPGTKTTGQGRAPSQ